MKSLLVAIEPVEPRNGWYRSLAAAAGHLSAKFAASVEVVGIDAPPDFRVPDVWGGDSALMAKVRREAVEAAGQIYRDEFADGRLCPNAAWAGVLDASALGAHARLFDLAILARPEESPAGPSRTPVESVLFSSGRPLLLVPDWAAPIGSNIVIAWIDTPETARAVTAAMPFLKSASKVRLLALTDGRVPSEQAAGVAAYLARHGVDAELTELHIRGSAGETMLAFATDVGANLLVKGAYTETKLKRFIFGDATDHLISHARLPLFLTH
jgi:nucleotide-binding universal stress UspA family protein